MTREEAISIMNAIVHMLEPQYDTDRIEDSVEMAIKALKQDQCEDCISREEMWKAYHKMIDSGNTVDVYDAIKNLPFVTPMPKMGRWIYDKNIDNWKCSECGETPKTMGYCGAAAFMAEHFKYCNHCGTKMGEVEE